MLCTRIAAKGADHGEGDRYHPDQRESRIVGCGGLTLRLCSFPYAGRLNTKPVKVSNLDDLVTLLMNLKISEDEATRWAGKARTQGVVLISGVERTEVAIAGKWPAGLNVCVRIPSPNLVPQSLP